MLLNLVHRPRPPDYQARFIRSRSRTLAYCWLRECLLPLFLCFIRCFTAYRLDQFIEEALVNGLRFEVILLFGLAQFSSDNFGRHFSHSGQEHVCNKAVRKDKWLEFQGMDTFVCIVNNSLVPFWSGNGANWIIDEPAKQLSSDASHV